MWQVYFYIIPKRTKNIRPHKNVYTRVHGSIIQNNQKMEVTQMSTTDEQVKYDIPI